MRRWHRWALTGSLLAATGAGALLLFAPDPGERDGAEARPPIDLPAPAPAPTEPAAIAPSPELPATPGAISASETATVTPESSTARPDMAGDALATNSFMAWMDAAVESVQNATPDEYRERRERAERGDAEAAFWLHWYFFMCMDSPRTEWQLERVLAEIREGIDGHDDAMREAMAQYAEQVLDGFRLCSVLEPEFDARLAALEWLQLAADLGYHGARRMYHFQAKHLLSGAASNLVFREPGRISEFKARAADYAHALMETGHPQAYLLAAEMYLAGAAYPRDYVKSYAYALAAMAFDGMESDTQMTRNLARQHLSPSQVREAERLADEILDQE